MIRVGTEPEIHGRFDQAGSDSATATFGVNVVAVKQ
jgi:hypothetical protein